MTEQLQEIVSSQGVAIRVDRPASVIRGVKILGLTSRNGRVYRPAALQQAAALYENAKVNVNHAQTRPGAPRDYQDRIGTIRGVAVRADEGLFADFHFNPKHAVAEQLLWDAEHAPENVGFSHNVEAKTSRQGDQVVVEAITRVQSVDLVADPATTRGLFESAHGDGGPATLEDVTLEELRRARPDLVEAVVQAQAEELEQLRAELARRQAVEAEQSKRTAARRVLRECGLPDPDSADARERTIAGGTFFEALLACADEPSMRRLAEERARLVRAVGENNRRPSLPTSRGQHEIHAAASGDVSAFVAAIT